MKIQWFRTLIKVWIAICSVIAFLFGWILLGHSGKPVSASSGSSTSQLPANVQPLPTLAPLPQFDSGTGLQPLQQQQSQPSFSFFPPMRTMGS